MTHITGNTPSTMLDTSTWMIRKNNKLVDAEFDYPRGIDLILAADVFYEMIPSGRKTRPGNYPVLEGTVIGWTLSGCAPNTTTHNDPQHIFLLRRVKSLEQNLNRFWELEPLKQSTMTTEQQFCEQHFITHTTQQQDGRFFVRLPTKMDP